MGIKGVMQTAKVEWELKSLVQQQHTPALSIASQLLVPNAFHSAKLRLLPVDRGWSHRDIAVYGSPKLIPGGKEPPGPFEARLHQE